MLDDENVPSPVAHALRERGYDVAWLAEDLASTADPDVLTLAQD